MPVLADISMELEVSKPITSSICCLTLSGSAAGKSTLLKAIMGLIKVSAGRFYINGIEKTNLF